VKKLKCITSAPSSSLPHNPQPVKIKKIFLLRPTMTPENLLGHRLGPYQIEEIIGSGGMAVVYRARAEDGRTVALKVLFPPPNAAAEIRLRFEREARTAARLNHPAIVRVFEAGQAGGYAYLAMEFIKGQTLAQRLFEQSAPLSEDEAADIAWQIADALYYAHGQGVVHRDVKPSNILLTDDNRALLTDFGVAQAFDDPSLTRTGHTVGTPAYMAPEQAGGLQPLDGRADLYALGVVLYHMVAGRPPFQGSTPQILHAHLYDPPPPPSSLSQVSPGMEAIILKALAKEAGQRFQTGAAMAQALASLSGQASTRLLPQTPKHSAGRIAGWAWIAGILLVIAIIIGGVILFFNPDEPPVLVATTSLPTSTNTPRPPTATFTPTPSPQIVTPEQPIAASPQTPTSTPTPPPTPTPTPTPSPTPEPSPTPLPPPTSTPAPTATTCPQPADAAFVPLLAPAGGLNELLGCPRSAAVVAAAAWQPFETGSMLWREDANLIYVLDANKLWRSTGDTWREGDLQFDPAIQVPNGLHQPVRGFGLVWREQPGVRDALGWATAAEDGFEALVQEFGGGSIWQDPERNAFFILFNNGTYQTR
jgi:serine/threonine-protein kinase